MLQKCHDKIKFSKTIDNRFLTGYNIITELHESHDNNFIGGHMKLSDIASVKTGLVLSRKQAKDKEKGIEYRLLNLKAVTNNCEINMNELIAYYAEEELPSNYLTQTGDVIIKTSEPYTAVYRSFPLELQQCQLSKFIDNNSSLAKSVLTC